jgi:hypothetical protein
MKSSRKEVSVRLPTIYLLSQQYIYVEENPHIEMNSYLKLPSWHKITNDLMAKYQGELWIPLPIQLTITI